jgi:hypothetical protein
MTATPTQPWCITAIAAYRADSCDYRAHTASADC